MRIIDENSNILYNLTGMDVQPFSFTNFGCIDLEWTSDSSTVGMGWLFNVECTGVSIP